MLRYNSGATTVVSNFRNAFGETPLQLGDNVYTDMYTPIHIMMARQLHGNY